MAPLSPGLPSPYYTDPRIVDLEQERIFNRSWQLVGHVTDLPTEGSHFVASLGRTEVVVVRSKSDEVLAHVNSCRHRGTRLVSEPGEAKAFRCPYHGWTYHLDGELVGAPEGRTIPCLDKTKLSLFSARVEIVSGLIFVNLDLDAEPLASQLDGIRPLLDRYLGGEMEPFGKHRLHRDDPAEAQPSNWKIGVDNYLEGYHVPVAHPGLMRLLDYKRYTVETAEAYAVYDAPLREKPSDNWAERLYQRLVRPMPGLAKEDERVFRYIAIYPNTVIDLYPDHVLLWRLTPQGVDRVGVPGTYLRRKNCDVRTRVAQRLNLYFSETTTHEDEELVRWMQRGLSNFEDRDDWFSPGPLSLREQAVAWFADRIRADLGDLTDLEKELDR